jgi:C_GCAxxG_C_C family probable redox protein
MTRTEKAADHFKQGFNCSQAVFTAFRQENIDEATALKLSTVFGAGVACSGSGMCGAVSGALMAISHKYGRQDAQSLDARARTYDMGKKFIREFTDRNGSVMCGELLGMNIGTPENMQKATEMGLFRTKCCELVKSAGMILEDQL